MKTKVCTKCGKRKSVSEFAHDCTKKDGLKGQCKECTRAASAKYRKVKKAEKRLAETKKNFKKALMDEMANRKAVSAKTAKGKNLQSKKEEVEAITWVGTMIKDVVQAIADRFNLDASVIVQLKHKK